MENVILYPGTNLPELVARADLRSIEVVFEEGYLPVRDIDQEHVEQLVASELEGVPPIEIVRTSEGLVVVDGYHRAEAARRLQRTHISAIARTYASDTQVIDAAFQANMKHGKGADKGLRSEYAVWLYTHDTTGKPNLSAIARKVGLNQTTVSRAIKKALREAREAQEEAETNSQEQVQYNQAMTDYTQRLTSALTGFFRNEHAIFGSLTGKRSETARAKALARSLKGTPENVAFMQSLARTFNEAATLLTQKQKGA